MTSNFPRLGLRCRRERVLSTRWAPARPLMSKPIDHLSFEQWVYFIFDHPEEGPAWYADPDAPYWNGPAALTAEYVIRLFEDPALALEGFRMPNSTTGCGI